MKPTVIIEKLSAATAVLTLNRPEKRNALTIELMENLAAQIRQLESDPDCRVMILRGAGKVFCAGLDLIEAADLAVAQESAKWVGKTFETIATSRLVTIAAAQGAAYAGGAGVMSSCDVVIASSDLKIGFPEVRRGLVPALVAHVLRHRLRDSEMRELFLTAEPIDARRAADLGLVQRVVEAEFLLATSIEFAQTICRGGPEAVRHTKQLIRSVYTNEADRSIDAVIEMHTRARTSKEAAEGLAAFSERRDPDW